MATLLHFVRFSQIFFKSNFLFKKKSCIQLCFFVCFFIGVVVQFGVRLEVFVIVFGHMSIFFVFLLSVVYYLFTTLTFRYLIEAVTGTQ